jgi:hypothetical protein
VALLQNWSCFRSKLLLFFQEDLTVGIAAKVLSSRKRREKDDVPIINLRQVSVNKFRLGAGLEPDAYKAEPVPSQSNS